MKLTRREILRTAVCSPPLMKLKLRPRLTPATFPWAVDRTGYIARRSVPSGQETMQQAVDLVPLNAALESYMTEPDNPRRIALVRHHLGIVHAATAHHALPFPWREMHYGCELLLNAPAWHPVQTQDRTEF